MIMKTMLKSFAMQILFFTFLALGVVKASYEPVLHINLPNTVTTPDGIALDASGNIFVSAPNFSNDLLLKEGSIKTKPTERIVMFDKNNKAHDFYIFSKKDKQKDTGRVGPMELKFGPDGNLYVADMQVTYDNNYKSRLVRINVKNGKAVGMDVLVEGFIAANGLAWRGDTLFVTEPILKHSNNVNGKKEKLISGVYAFTLEEMNKGLIKLKPFEGFEKNKKWIGDEHLIATFESSNKKGFGADGVVVDNKGNLYTSVVEDGIIYKTTFDKNNKVVKTVKFAEDKKMASADGMAFDEASNKIYTADFFINAIHSIDLKTKKVETLFKNDDSDGKGGLLEQPAAVVIKGDYLLITNMDVAWLAPSVNTKTEKPFTVSAIKIK